MAYFLGQSVGDKRYEYRATLLREGIDQNRRGYQPEINHSMTDFVQHYVRFANAQFPDLNVEKAKPRLPAAECSVPRKTR